MIKKRFDLANFISCERVNNKIFPLKICFEEMRGKFRAESWATVFIVKKKFLVSRGKLQYTKKTSDAFIHFAKINYTLSIEKVIGAEVFVAFKPRAFMVCRKKF